MKTMKKFTGILFLITFLVSCMQKDNLTDEQTVIAGNDLQVTKSAGIPETIEGRYIVVFNDRVTNPAAEAARLKGMFGLESGHVYEHSLKGFSAKIPAQALNGLRNHPLIDYIEPEMMLYANEQTIPTGIRRIEAQTSSLTPVDVDVAIIDTGIDKDHPELNVVGGIRYYLSFLTDNLYDDDNGHGSHVAGIIGARNNTIGVVGIVPGARLWAVKVLNKRGSGYLSDIMKGLEWVESHAADIEVANMSIGGTGYSDSYRTAIKGCVDAGVVVVVAAGNSAVDVYGTDGKFQTSDDYVPAAYPEAATISAMADSDGMPGGTGGNTSYGQDDSFATFSNFSRSVVAGNPVTSPGFAIDLILPGVDILSCYKDMNYAIMSGTSMASPHGAGLAALFISKHGRAANAAGVYAIRQALINAGIGQTEPKGLINDGDPDGNRENIGWAGTGSIPDNLPPVANAGPDQTVNENTLVTLDGSGSSDPDNDPLTFLWTDPSDKLLSSATSVNPTFTAPDVAVETTFTFSLVVNDGKISSSQDEVIITVKPVTVPSGIIITNVRIFNLNKVQYAAELTWNGGTSAYVDIYKDGTKAATTENDGLYVLNLGKKLNPDYTFKICETGTEICSAPVTVTN